MCAWKVTVSIRTWKEGKRGGKREGGKGWERTRASGGPHGLEELWVPTARLRASEKGSESWGFRGSQVARKRWSCIPHRWEGYPGQGAELCLSSPRAALLCCLFHPQRWCCFLSSPNRPPTHTPLLLNVSGCKGADLPSLTPPETKLWSFQQVSSVFKFLMSDHLIEHSLFGESNFR